MMLQIVVVLACLALTLGFNFVSVPKVALKMAKLHMSTPDAAAGQSLRNFCTLSHRHVKVNVDI
jgi:hypothetical protein